MSNNLFTKNNYPVPLQPNTYPSYGFKGNYSVRPRPIALSSSFPQPAYPPIPAPISFSYPQPALSYSYPPASYPTLPSPFPSGSGVYSNHGLEYILIAILILVSLDLIFVRPLKNQNPALPSGINDAN